MVLENLERTILTPKPAQKVLKIKSYVKKRELLGQPNICNKKIVHISSLPINQHFEKLEAKNSTFYLDLDLAFVLFMVY